MAQTWACVLEHLKHIYVNFWSYELVGMQILRDVNVFKPLKAERKYMKLLYKWVLGYKPSIKSMPIQTVLEGVGAKSGGC